MNTYKTINVLNRLSSLIGINCEPTDEERDFIYNIEIEIAKSILNDFGKDSSKEIAKIILAVVE